jgi:tRNA (cytidine/uridine-2'-O-)-methyltransferase
MYLCDHQLKIVLRQPQIAPNTGNIGRLCVASGTELHLVRPLGFLLTDSYLKRSGMDYWPRLKLTVHDDQEAFFRVADPSRIWLFTRRSTRSYWETQYTPSDYLIFGSETHGLNDALLAQYPDRCVRIPQVSGERCLNLSTAAGIGLYEALRQVQEHSPHPNPPPEYRERG